MKKILLLLSFIFIHTTNFSQAVTLKGSVVKKNFCTFSNDSGYIVYKTQSVSNISAKITSTDLTFYGDFKKKYILSDKQVDSSSNKLIIHFYGECNDDTYIIAVKETDEDNSEGEISVAVFPLYSEDFMEYIIKLVN